MTLLTASQMAAIRSLGVQGMITTAVIKRYLGLSAPTTDEDPDPTYETTGTTVKCWVVARMDRDFEEDGQRIVAVHDFTVRVPVGTVIEARDMIIIEGVTCTVVESSTEDTWPEWTVVYAKKVA